MSRAHHKAGHSTEECQLKDVKDFSLGGQSAGKTSALSSLGKDLQDRSYLKEICGNKRQRKEKKKIMNDSNQLC